MKLKLFSIWIVVSISVLAAAQTRSVPYVVSTNGTIIDVGYEFEGLLPGLSDATGKLVSTKGCVKVTASQNTQSLRMLCDSIDGTPKTPIRLTVHECLPNGGAIGGGQI